MTICSLIKKEVLDNIPEILSLRDKKTLKEDNSFVSEGDLLCQDIIINLVGNLDEQFQIVSEEMDLSDFNYDPQKNYIVVDPIDGTENFVSGLKEWGVGVCVYKCDKHVESMILLPELQEWLITGMTAEQYQSRIYGLSSSLTKEDLIKLPTGVEYRIMGCSMYNLFNVIKGCYVGYENVKQVNCWDILPGANLALENGLEVYINGERYDGRFLSPDIRYRVKIQR